MAVQLYREEAVNTQTSETMMEYGDLLIAA